MYNYVEIWKPILVENFVLLRINYLSIKRLLIFCAVHFLCPLVNLNDFLRNFETLIQAVCLSEVLREKPDVSQ